VPAVSEVGRGHADGSVSDRLLGRCATGIWCGGYFPGP